MSKKHKEDKETKYPKTIHVINLGTTKHPDFVAGEDAKDILNPTFVHNGEDSKGEIVATYQLVETAKMRLTQVAEVL